MVNKRNPLNHETVILETIRDNTGGVTVSDIANLTKFSRNSVSKFILTFERTSQIFSTIIFNSILYHNFYRFLSQIFVLYHMQNKLWYYYLQIVQYQIFFSLLLERVLNLSLFLLLSYSLY